MRYNLAIRNGLVLTPQGQIRADLRIEKQSIESVGNKGAADCEIDATGLHVVPGFVDIHMHGIGFYSVMSGDLSQIAALEAKQGTTAFLPTLFAPPAETMDNMQRHLGDTDKLREVGQVVGFRLESPYLGYTGAGVPKDLAPVTRELTDALLEAGEGKILIWDISPEIDNACEEIAYLSSKGIICSLAHTRATIEEARAGVDAGARLVTHLFDTFVVPEMIDPGVFPVSLIDYILTEDRLKCEIIGDGTHVHAILVEKALRCKSKERVIFVTDSNLGAALEDGDYDLPGGWGRARVAGPNNGVRLIDREMGLAGSALTPCGSFANAVQMFNQDFSAASELCSANPARLLGLKTGILAPGYDADIVLLDDQLSVRTTICKGKVIFDNRS